MRNNRNAPSIICRSQDETKDVKADLDGLDIRRSAHTRMSHVEEFGGFYAYLVLLTCPLIGFAVFWVVSRPEVGWQFWKPFAVAIAFAPPAQQFMRHGFLALGMDEPAAEAARAVVVLLLIIFSIAAFRISGWRQRASEQSVIA